MVVPCNISGKQGFMWDESGVCYTGPDARERAFREGFVKELTKRRKGLAFNQGAFAELSTDEFGRLLLGAQREIDKTEDYNQTQTAEALQIIIDRIHSLETDDE